MTDGLDPQSAEANVFGTACHHFPAMVRLNGLRLTVAFYEAKAQAGAGALTGRSGNNAIEKAGEVNASARARAYQRYLRYMRQALVPEEAELGKAISSSACTEDQYRLLSRQALAASVWFKRYAEAILKAEPTAEAGGESL